MKTDPVLQPVILEMLKVVETVLHKRGIDFYLVGATARDFHLSARPGLMAVRGTKDIDIAILVGSEEEFQAVREELIATGDFEPHSREVIRLFYKNTLEVDFLPFGGIENEQREARIEKPRLFVMDVPGFREAYGDMMTVTLEGLEVPVCSVEGLIVLKLLAWDDRPGRTKDITDIDTLISVYFELYGEEVFESYPEVMDFYEAQTSHYLELVSARVIGRKMGKILSESPGLLHRVAGILARRPVDTWQAVLEGLADK